MLKENVMKFLKKAPENESLQKILKSKGVPKDIEETAKLFAEIAADSGEDIPAEDFAEVLSEWESAQLHRTEKAVSDIESLEDTALENVAGGSGDWCWFNDENAIFDCGQVAFTA